MHNGNGKSDDEQVQGLVFPCDFPLKMFGKNTLSFIAEVDEVIEEHVPRSDWVVTRTNESSNKNYLSYTVVVRARNRQQLDSVCAAVTKCPAVIMAL